MKQKITPKQLDELSDKGKERLRKWWKPQNGDICAGCPHSTRHKFGTCLQETVWYSDSEWGYPEGWQLPLLSIGQMIEFLGDSNKWVHMPNMMEMSGMYNIETICDALWEAVKEVLEAV